MLVESHSNLPNLFICYNNVVSDRDFDIAENQTRCAYSHAFKTDHGWSRVKVFIE